MKPSRSQQPQPAEELQIFIRIKHPSLDPTEITRNLDMQPEQTIAAGANISSTGVRRLHNETYWIARLPSITTAELVGHVRDNPFEDFASMLRKEELIGLIGASEHDMRILLRLKRFESNQDFFDRINRDGGSVTLIVDRGDPDQPVVLKHALKKLVTLGIALEID